MQRKRAAAVETVLLSSIITHPSVFTVLLIFTILNQGAVDNLEYSGSKIIVIGPPVCKLCVCVWGGGGGGGG